MTIDAGQRFLDGADDSAAKTAAPLPGVGHVLCLVAGTLVATTKGEVRAELLRPGDRVLTEDNGAQPLLWTGSHLTIATGDDAPVRIEADVIGSHPALTVAPEHRIVFRDQLAALLFGEAEVLVEARDLVNDDMVCQIEGSFVTYVHLLFDQRQVLNCQGLLAETSIAGPQFFQRLDPDRLADLCTRFPEMAGARWETRSPSARPTLPRLEAQVLLATGLAA